MNMKHRVIDFFGKDRKGNHGGVAVFVHDE